jgi:hypothetical protein
MNNIISGLFIIIIIVVIYYLLTKTDRVDQFQSLIQPDIVYTLDDAEIIEYNYNIGPPGNKGIDGPAGNNRIITRASDASIIQSLDKQFQYGVHIVPPTNTVAPTTVPPTNTVVTTTTTVAPTTNIVPPTTNIVASTTNIVPPTTTTTTVAPTPSEYPYKYLGSYSDKYGDRSLKYGPGTQDGRIYTKESCANTCIKLNDSYKFFSLQYPDPNNNNKSECWCSDNKDDSTKYGNSSSECKPNGGTWCNALYENMSTNGPWVDWVDSNGNRTVVRLDKTNKVECASPSSGNCFWNTHNAAAINNMGDVKTHKCGNKPQPGGSGWCNALYK